ncbi:MAG: YceD family protein, partial [Acidobacteriota bacterium]
MADPLRPLRINAVELLRQPGAVRDVSVDVTAEPLDVEHDRLAGDIHVELRLTALNDGIDVDGTVSADWATVCRRCLVDVSGTAVGTVDELYQIDPLDPDA